MHLIIGKDKEEVRRALRALVKDASVLSFYPETFSKDFFQEVETLPFLPEKKRVVLYNINSLGADEVEKLCRYLSKPNKWVELYLTAEDLSAQSKLVKLVEKQGQVTRFKEEKPWEREKKIAQWLIAEAGREGVSLSLHAATVLVQGIDNQLLESELHKLLCYIYPRKEITLEDLASICLPVPNESIWKLSDALLARSAKRALEIGCALLNEGIAIFSLLASLRSQFMTALKMLGSDGKGASSNNNFLEKKMALYRKYGKMRLQRGALLIFDAELQAKNGAHDAHLLLELLTIRLVS